LKMLKIKKEENEILAVGKNNFISKDQIGFMAPTELNERERNKLTSTMNGILLLNHTKLNSNRIFTST